MEIGGSTVLGAAYCLIWARLEGFFVETCFNYFLQEIPGQTYDTGPVLFR
jgi:hypothetical protein